MSRHEPFGQHFSLSPSLSLPLEASVLQITCVSVSPIASDRHHDQVICQHRSFPVAPIAAPRALEALSVSVVTNGEPLVHSKQAGGQLSWQHCEDGENKMAAQRLASLKTTEKGETVSAAPPRWHHCSLILLSAACFAGYPENSALWSPRIVILDMLVQNCPRAAPYSFFLHFFAHC